MSKTAKIFLAETPEMLVLDSLPGPTLVVSHPKCPAPIVPGGVEMDFKEFAKDARSALKGMGSLVLSGLNHMVTPSNRTQMVWEVVFNNSRDFHRIVVNREPFISMPWRIWFNFGAVGADYREFTYSYLAESQWQYWFEGDSDFNPFSLEEVLKWSKGVVQSDYKRWFTNFEVDIRETDHDTRARYAELKERAFSEEKTIKAIIKRLSDFASEVCPQRFCPSGAKLFSTRDLKLVLTDLGVDDFWHKSTRHLVELTNGITEGTYNGQG